MHPHQLRTSEGSRDQPRVDPLGRLFHINRSETDFRYDGSEVIEETKAYTGVLRRRFVHGPGPATGSGQADEPLVVYACPEPVEGTRPEPSAGSTPTNAARSSR